MKILLVYTEINIKFGAYGFQHGIAALSAYLKSKGYHNVRLYYLSPRFSHYAFQKTVSDFQPDIIGFYTTHDQYRFIKKFINDIKSPDVFILCGGPHATLNPEMIYEIPRLNAVCIGEGEIPLLEAVKTLEKKEKPVHIKNLWVRDNKKIVRNEPLPFFENLDELPFIDRGLFSESKSWNRIGLTQICYKNSFRISRGCPYQCSFCSNKQIGNAQPGSFSRFRSVDRVLEEIESTVKKFSPKEVYFEDDSFTLNKSFLDEFCEKYPTRVGLPFEFFSHIGPSTISSLENLRKAGGRRVSFGIESGNEELRKKILKKNFSNKDVIRVFKEAKKMGYHTEAFIMTGLPEETKESSNDTVKLLREIQPDLYSLSIYFPFRGTDLYEYSVEKGYIASDFEIPDTFVSRRDTLLHMPGFTQDEILRSVRTFGWEVYKDLSLKKAILFRLYESRIGDILLRFIALYKSFIRQLIIGNGF